MPFTADISYKVVKQADVDHRFRKNGRLPGDSESATPLTLEGWDLRHIDLSKYYFPGAQLKKVNLAGKDLRDVDLAGVELFESDLSNSNLKGHNLSVHQSVFSTCDLSNADLRDTILNARFYDCTFDGTRFDDARLDNVIFSKTCRGVATQFVKSRFLKVQILGCLLNRANFRGACMDHLEVQQTKILKGDFSDTTGSLLLVRDSQLQGCHFNQTKIGFLDLGGVVNLVGTFFVNATLRGANLVGADLTDADLRDARLEEANLSGAIVDHADFTGASGLFGRHAANLSDIKGARRARFGEKKDHFNWEFLRKVGRIPLFGASNLAIIVILLMVAGARWYNAQVEVWQTDPRITGQDQLLQQLHDIHLPWHVGVTLLAIVLLAGGSGIYKYRCPEEIDHYSSTEWEIEHGRPLITYFSLSHSQKVWRRLSGWLYLLGVGWTVLYLIVRTTIAVHFLLVEPVWKVLRSLWLAA